MSIKKGDYIVVIQGDETGKKGRVLRMVKKKNKLVAEGINYVFKHMKKSQANPQGGRIQKEAPLNVANVKLFCPHCQAPTSVVYKYEVPEEKKENEGKDKAGRRKIRYCKNPSCARRL